MLRRTLAVLAVFLLTLPLLASDWPQWRGPDRTDVSKETGLLMSWPEGGPKLNWEAKGAGRGYATVAISKGKLYTVGDEPSSAKDKDEYLSCFNDATGKLLWQTRLGPAWSSGQPNWQSSRSTPTVDDDRVYVLTPHGVLHCLDSSTGKDRWKKDLKALGGQKADGWGYSESVLVDGDKVVCTPGGPKKTMLALNKKTGDVIWTAASSDDRGAGHSSIVISEVGGTRVYVQSTGSGPMGVRAKDGKVLWTYPVPKITAIIPTPIVHGDLVFFVAGYSGGGALLRQVPEPNIGIKIEEIYGMKPPLKNKHGGVVLFGDYLYGDTDDSGRPYCAELMTGTVKWKASRPSGSGSASMTVADGRLYIHYANGTAVLADASPQGYKESGSFKVPGSGERPSWSHPVVANGQLYLREQDRIFCYNVKATN